MIKFNSILLVDDDEISNFISKRVIDKMDIANHVYVRKNGREALDFIYSTSGEQSKEICPDLILLDIKMPVMDGFEFLEELRKGTDKFKILMLSSSNNPNDITRSVSYQVQGYITKPLTLEILSSALERV